ncbi:unnamed protein product, partial [Ectocarpus sp. 12 AP-2014]
SRRRRRWRTSARRQPVFLCGVSQKRSQVDFHDLRRSASPEHVFCVHSAHKSDHREGSLLEEVKDGAAGVQEQNDEVRVSRGREGGERERSMHFTHGASHCTGNSFLPA